MPLKEDVRMAPWEWITTTTSFETVLTTLGLGTMAILFATDRILTKGQHLRRVQDIVASNEKFVASLQSAYEQRVADLVAHHAREIAEKDLRIADLAASGSTWKEAAGLERERADKVTDTVADVVGPIAGIQHVLESLHRALPASPGGQQS